MAILENASFDENPLSVSLEVHPQDEEGWRPFKLSLVYGPDHDKELAGVSEAFYKDDHRVLINALRGLATGTETRVDYEPLEPSFLLRGQRLLDGDIELAWFVDQGEIENRVSTGTGPGILIQVEAQSLLDFADALEAEGSETR